MTRDWVVLDTETTGLGPDRQPVQVAVVDARGRLLFESLIRPTQPCEPAARRIHGLADELLRSAPAPAAVLPTLTPLLDGKTVYAYGATFDRNTLLWAYRRARLSFPASTWLCVHDLYSETRGFSAPLRTVCEIEGIATPDGPHSAPEDARLTWKILQAVKE